jgi:microcystin-dependent protein
MSSILRRSASLSAQEKPVTGDMKMSFVPYDHIGWLVCDGRAVSTTTYNLLFQVIGYQFGGSGSTFNLPRPAGGVVGVVGQRSTTVTTTLHPPGQDVGEETHQLTIAEMPSHNHGVAAAPQTATNNLTSAYTHNHGGTTGDAGSAAESETVMGGIGANVSGSGSHNHSITSDTHTHSLNAAGGDVAHNNIQPTLFMGNMFIYSGIPSAPGFTPSSWPKNAANPPLI